MPHWDAELLALEALGEPVASAAERDHAAGCAQCREELAELRSVVGTARTGRAPERPVPPPERVWDGIRAELGWSGDATGPTGGAGAGAGAGLGADAGVGGGTGAPPAPPRLVPVPPPPAGGSEPRPHRARRRVPTLAAAAAGVLAGLGLAAVLAALLPSQDPAREVASVQLAPLPGATATGTARLLDSDGTRSLALDLRQLPPGNGYYEVWLLDRPAQRLVSLGVLGDGTGTFRLPDGLDLTSYPVVDVSREPLDGDPAHSSDSVARGTLPG